MPELSPAELSFVSPHLGKDWQQKGNSQLAWAKGCDRAADELAADVLALRHGSAPLPVNMARYLYDRAAEKRRKLTAQLGHPPEYGELRKGGDPISTVLLDEGTYGNQFSTFARNIEMLAKRDGAQVAPGLHWKADREEKNGLAVTTVRLLDDEARTLQTLQHLEVTEKGKSLGDYIGQLNPDKYPQWNDTLTKSGIADKVRGKTEAALIVHTPPENIDRMLSKADAALTKAVLGDGSKEELKGALGEAAWTLGIAVPLKGGSASTTDIIVKALMKANAMEITPYRADVLNWDLSAMTAPREADFVHNYNGLFAPPAEERKSDSSLPHKIQEILERGVRQVLPFQARFAGADSPARG